MLNTGSISTSLETKQSLFSELRGFHKGGLLDLGHTLLNRIADSFLKAASIGAIQAASREAYVTTTEGFDSSSGDIPAEIITGQKKNAFPDLNGENNRKSLEALDFSGEEYWKGMFTMGLDAGVYSGFTYGLVEARGAHDWKNSAVPGAMIGVTLALTSEGSSHEQIVQGAITGAAIATTANLLSGIF